MARPRILATAYACRPGSGSEEGNGWWLADQLRRFGDVCVVTPSHNRAVIEAAVTESDGRGRLEFVYVDVPGWPTDSSSAHRLRRTHYNLWQLRIWATARELHAARRFDLVHHLTYGQYWSGSWMGELDLPFVWGPVGGGESAPDELIAALSKEGRAYERRRDFARRVGRLSPPVRRSARKATVALAATPQTGAALESLGVGHIELMPTAGLPDVDFTTLSNIPRDASRSALRVMCLGRLEYWKGFHFAIEGFGRFVADAPGSELWVIGDGPAASHLRDVVRLHRLERSVKLLGRLPRAEVLERLAASHVLAHPSLHDSAGWATLEAAASGLPVVCLDLGGPALQVTSETGIKIAPYNHEQIVAEIADAFRTLAEPAHALRLGLAGRARVEANFTWSRLGDRLGSFEPYRSLA